MLKRLLLVCLCKLVGFHMSVTGAWSLMLMGWILYPEIFGMIKFLVRKKTMRE